MPGRLRAVVCRGMEQVQAVLVEAQRAESVASSRKLNVLGEPLSLRRSCSDHQIILLWLKYRQLGMFISPYLLPISSSGSSCAYGFHNDWR